LTGPAINAVLLNMRVALALTCLTVLVASATAQDQPTSQPLAPVRFIEREMWIPAAQALPNGLDSVEVYADRPGRHPLVVLTHGTSPDRDVRMQVTPWAYLQQAVWFARRGYVAIVVVRKGYGKSGGHMDGYFGGCNGKAGGFDSAGEASADDLRTVIRYAASLPEVDPATAVSAGVSTGGFAQVALSADPTPNLKAAISFAGGRGGDGHENNCDLSNITAAFGGFGKGARKHGQTPMLWIYSENDHWFPPAMARQFEAAYIKGGGVDQFVLAPPYGDEGHHLFGHVDAWSDIVESFLKAHDLLPLADQVYPEPVVADLPPPPGLSSSGIEAWKGYLRGAPYKAFATNGQGAWGFAQAKFNQNLADTEALDRCKKAATSKGDCSVVARTPKPK
jgi:dienelactone hydrolase